MDGTGPFAWGERFSRLREKVAAADERWRAVTQALEPEVEASLMSSYACEQGRLFECLHSLAEELFVFGIFLEEFTLTHFKSSEDIQKLASSVSAWRGSMYPFPKEICDIACQMDVPAMWDQTNSPLLVSENFEHEIVHRMRNSAIRAGARYVRLLGQWKYKTVGETMKTSRLGVAYFLLLSWTVVDGFSLSPSVVCAGLVEECASLRVQAPDAPEYRACAKPIIGRILGDVCLFREASESHRGAEIEIFIQKGALPAVVDSLYKHLRFSEELVRREKPSDGGRKALRSTEAMLAGREAVAVAIWQKAEGLLEALTMGRHARLGEGSLLRWLGQDTFSMLLAELLPARRLCERR